MRSSDLVSLVAFLTTTTCTSLRRAEFNVLISSRQSLILFTAEGCKECDRVQGVLDKASPVLKKTAIALVNCHKEPLACDDAKVFTVPTLKYTSGDGDLVTYKESLDASSIVKYIDRQSGNPVKDLTDEGLANFATSARVAVVAFGLSYDRERKAFSDVAEAWRAYYSFGSVESLDGHAGEPSIAVYTQEQDEPIYYRGPFNMDGIENFLRSATTPLILEMDPVVYVESVKVEKPLAQIFFDKYDERADLIKSLIPLAKRYKDQLVFMTVLVSDYPKTCEKMHLSTDSKRGFAIADLQGRAYPMSTTVFNVNRIDKHISAYLAGKLTPTIKSEPVPTPSASQHFLTRLVGSNFDEFVYDKSRDVVVEFHVPWCDYCIELHTQMNKLGSKYAASGYSKQVSLATINVDANDVPIEIDSYPSIRLYRAGTNEIVPFHGNFTQMLTEEQLDTFIRTGGSQGISVFHNNKALQHEEL